MKKFYYLLSLFLILSFFSCEDSTDQPFSDKESEIIDMSDFYLDIESSESLAKAEDKGKFKNCQTMEVLSRKLIENPGLYQKMYAIEKHSRTVIANAKGSANRGKPGNGGGGTDPVPPSGTVNIPVIVNIIEISAGDVTQAQIDSQIKILNEDYNNNNPNTSNVPSDFAGLVADCDITFVLAGVNRKVSTKSSWGTNDAMKFASQGGIDVTDPSNYLNIWVCNIGGGILGYAQFPGGSPSTDGVVIGTAYFGETSGVYGDGRTATHEVGHWLNLRHIWGDGRCNRDDFVADTPTSDRYNSGCPSYPTIHCNSADMTMNYMDYVYDDCMYMFTPGQNDRMRALFAPGGSRESFIN